MNEFLRNFVMTTILKMIESDRPEWEVRQVALGWYTKGVLTKEDLQTIEDKYKKEPEEEQPETEENVESEEE